MRRDSRSPTTVGPMQEPAPADAERATPPRSSSGNDIVKRFGDARSRCKGVVARAPRAASCVAIIGPNGAGKTTLLSILAGVQRADAGSVERPSPRRSAGCRSRLSLYGKLTVAENLRLFARLERCPDVRRRGRRGCWR